MLAEFVKSIVDLTNKAASFREVDLPGGKKRLIQTPTGELREVDIPPDDRVYLAGDLDSLVRLLGDADTDPIVFVATVPGESRLPVRAFYDKHDRRDSVAMAIGLSNALAALFSLGNWTDHKTVVQTLRDYLYDAAPADLIGTMRTLEFNRRNDGSRSVEHGRESLGRAVENEVKAKNGALPETVQLNLPFFATAPFADFVYRGDELALEIQRAVRNVRETIDDELNGDENGSAAIPVVIGSARAEEGNT